uniref:Uncharacterized protein n=1 Tax=Arundo donax TaxID=35708 RepID=A0A0A9A2U4_ARUDO
MIWSSTGKLTGPVDLALSFNFSSANFLQLQTNVNLGGNKSGRGISGNSANMLNIDSMPLPLMHTANGGTLSICSPCFGLVSILEVLYAHVPFRILSHGNKLFICSTTANPTPIGTMCPMMIPHLPPC